MVTRRVVLFALILAVLSCFLCLTATAGAAHTHSWREISRVNPTCTQSGRVVYVCSCGERKTERLSALGHRYSQKVYVSYADCTHYGVFYWVCDRCGAHSDNGNDKPLGHDWDEGVVTKEPGFLNPGETTYTCSRCGETMTEEIPAKELTDILRNSGPISVMNNDLPLLIVTHPEGGNILRGSGETLTLTVEASGGTKPYSYKWSREYIGNSTWGGFFTWWANKHFPLKADGNTCEAAAGNFAYYCRVTDDEEDYVDSYKANVYYSLYIEKQPENANIFGEDGVLLYCKAADGVPYDNGTYIYAWYKEDGSLVELTDYGITLVSEEGKYYCMVEDCNGGVATSDMITVYSTEPLKVTGLTDQAINEGETASLSVEVSGGVPPYSYQWGTREKKGDYYVSFDEIEGETSDSLEVPFSALGYYAVEVTDSMKSRERVTAEVKEYKEPLVIVEAPQPTEFTTLEKAELNIAVSEGETKIAYPLTYTLLKEGKKAETADSNNKSFLFPVDEAGFYAIHVEDAVGRTAETEYVQVTDNRLKITSITDEVCIHELGQQVILEVKVEGGRAPYQYKWVKTESLAAFEEAYGEYVSNDSVQSEYLDRYAVNEPFTTWSLEVKDADGATATAYPIKVTFDADLVLITKQPEDLKFEFEKNASYYTVLSCEAWSSQGHTLKYYWQEKYDDGWRYVTWLSQSSGPELPTSQGGTFRCKITDLTTGKETYTRVAEVKMPKVDGKAHQEEFNSTTILLSVYGGTGPYTITATREYRSIKPRTDYYFVTTEDGKQKMKVRHNTVTEKFNLQGHIQLIEYDESDPHWAEYKITGVSKHKFIDGVMENDNYRHYTYHFEITDSLGNKGWALAKMRSPMDEWD